MKVIATKPGYFGKLREPGDIFEVPDGETASWFHAVKPADKKPKEPKPSDKPETDLV